MIAAFDALLMVTPEYDGSLPGQLKNMLFTSISNERPRHDAHRAILPAAEPPGRPS